MLANPAATVAVTSTTLIRRPSPCSHAAREWLTSPNITPTSSNKLPKPIDLGTESPRAVPPMTARPPLTATLTTAPTDIVRANNPRVEREEVSAPEGTVRATNQVARAAIQAPRTSSTATTATEVAIAGPSPLTGAETTSASLVRSFWEYVGTFLAPAASWLENAPVPSVSFRAPESSLVIPDAKVPAPVAAFARPSERRSTPSTYWLTPF